MGSHGVTCHPTQVNSPRLTPVRQTGTRFTYPGSVDLGDLQVVRYRDGLPTHRRSPIQVLNGPSVD